MDVDALLMHIRLKSLSLSASGMDSPVPSTLVTFDGQSTDSFDAHLRRDKND